MEQRIGVSARTSYRLDSRYCTGGAKDSSEEEIAHFQRETTAKSSEPRKRDQLLKAWFHPRRLRLHLPLLTTTRIVAMSGPHLLTYVTPAATVMQGGVLTRLSLEPNCTRLGLAKR
jgi:hypothetical protein